MTTPRISYAHALAQVNPKHVRSLVNFFEQGATTRGAGGFGVEIEHLAVRNGTDEAVTYGQERGVADLLTGLRPYYDEDREHWEDGHLVGLGRDGISLSVEPGGQLETSIGVLKEPGQLGEVYRRFRAEADPLLERLGFRFVEYGYQPKTSFEDIVINPKRRYAAMNEYLGRIGQFGPLMMRGSASTQVSIDYVDEADAIAKMRVGSAIGPILAYLFRNTPYFEGGRNPWPLARQRMWDYLDAQRTNVTPGLFDPRFSWEDYAVDVLGTPLMFADLTHTPEAAHLPSDALEFAAFHENANDVYPDRSLNDYEINHILSTHFNDVRLKNFIELRHWDSLPVERAQRLTEVVAQQFYDPEQRGRLQAYFDGLTNEDVHAAKAVLQAQGAEARSYGQPLEFWADFLKVGDTLASIPGDTAHPDVFQE
ncbi:MAG: glutamate-cysteine ligase family protein [Bifidobacterium sp.]|nr:glutamate-cysteine ligase family protein [Bifidobacterium sp.]